MMMVAVMMMSTLMSNAKAKVLSANDKAENADTWNYLLFHSDSDLSNFRKHQR